MSARRPLTPEELVVEACLRRKYVQRASDRQTSMGLSYTTAETSDLAIEIAKLLKAERLRCVRLALTASLPEKYQWGDEAMEHFNFGARRAAEAIQEVDYS